MTYPLKKKRYITAFLSAIPPKKKRKIKALLEFPFRVPVQWQFCKLPQWYGKQRLHLDFLSWQFHRCVSVWQYHKFPCLSKMKCVFFKLCQLSNVDNCNIIVIYHTYRVKWRLKMWKSYSKWGTSIAVWLTRTKKKKLLL